MLVVAESKQRQTEAKPAQGAIKAGVQRHPAPPAAMQLAFVSARFKHDPDWPWLTGVEPLSRCAFTRTTIENDFERAPKLTKLYQQWQYFKACRRSRRADATFLFSYDIAMGMTGPAARLHRASPCIYVGMHQDKPLEQSFIDKLSHALRRFAAVAILTDEERQLYIPRFGLDPAKTHVVPLHTDHAHGYDMYPDQSPHPEPYVLSMGSPNRVFKPTVLECAQRKIPIVIITRPWHKGDDLNELKALGAIVITDADMMKSLTYLKHAQMTVFDFDRTEYASGFITLVHAMFLRTPIVASNCVGIPEHVVDEKTGFVVPHDDQPALGVAIERLWNDSVLSMQFAHEGFVRAQDRHSLEAAAKAYYALAQRVIKHT